MDELGGDLSDALGLAIGDVRFGSLADIRPKELDVRFTPESGHWNRPEYYLRRSSSGSLAIFAAIRRAINSGVAWVTALGVNTIYFIGGSWWTREGAMDNEVISQAASDEKIISFDVPDEALERAASAEQNAFTMLYCTNEMYSCGLPQIVAF